VNELDAATANLKALQNAPVGVRGDDSGILALASQMTDRSVVDTVLFIGYLTIYGRLSHGDDRSATDRYIESSATRVGQVLKVMPTTSRCLRQGWLDSAEIRDARDRVRKLEGLFACAISKAEQ